MKYNNFRVENGVTKINAESKLLKFVLKRQFKKVSKALIEKGYLHKDKQIEASCKVEFIFNEKE